MNNHPATVTDKIIFMNEQDKINELMKPRYKVIGMYPFGSYYFALNEIVQLTEFDSREHLSKEQIEWYVVKKSKYAKDLLTSEPMLPMTMHESTFNQYPHLFKRLEWWEERKPEEMPEYVKNKHEVVKIEHHFSMYSLNISNEPLGVHTHFTYADKNTSNYTFWLPATTADYQAYITKPVNQESNP